MNPSRIIHELRFLSDTDYTLFVAQLKGVLQRMRNGESKEDIDSLLKTIRNRYPEVEFSIEHNNALKDYEIIRNYED